MVQFATLIPIIVGLSTLFKNLGIPSKYIPLFNIAFGLILAWFSFDANAIYETIIQGLVLGLSASGLYDQTKELIPNLTNSDRRWKRRKKNKNDEAA